MRWFFAFLGLILVPAKIRACDLALLLAVDVSGSVNPAEYDIQMRGIARGLRDPVVAEALVRADARIALVQWTGTSRQDMSIPWVRAVDFSTVEALANQVEALPRRWRNYATAIGEAQAFSITHMDAVKTCGRLVIDISGDGMSNEGVEPATLRAAFAEAGVSVNALAIETDDGDLTGYFWENVISGPGAFVVTADGFEDFADKMRRKLRRETTKQVSWLAPN